MNKVILMGRLTRDPDVRYSQGENSTAVARYSLAVDRRFSRNDENSTDFINIVAFGKAGEFAEKYLKKGTERIAINNVKRFMKRLVSFLKSVFRIRERLYFIGKQRGHSAKLFGVRVKLLYGITNYIEKIGLLV